MRSFVLTVIFLLIFCTSEAQVGALADSLQIKTYVVINYERYKAKSVEVTKIFCNYCNTEQKEYVKLQAWNWGYSVRKEPENILELGKRKLTFLLRIAKKDFRAMREEEE